MFVATAIDSHTAPEKPGGLGADHGDTVQVLRAFEMVETLDGGYLMMDRRIQLESTDPVAVHPDKRVAHVAQNHVERVQQRREYSGEHRRRNRPLCTVWFTAARNATATPAATTTPPISPAQAAIVYPGIRTSESRKSDVHSFSRRLMRPRLPRADRRSPPGTGQPGW